jgi:5-formyltetrahydrofolate cyclo-ligase
MTSALRKTLRARRHALGAATRTRLSRAITRHLLAAIGPAVRGRHIAGYAALADEPDLGAALAALARRGALIYLPRIDNYRLGRMSFARCDGDLRPNRYGIAEPGQAAPARRAADLDIALLPLVGFDAHGVRLGMGGGYYDRAFAFRRYPRAVPRPRLIGIAFACQQVDALPVAPHDVRLDAVVTESGLTRFARRTR